MIATQTFRHPRASTAGRLGAQAEGRHYSTFSLYTPQELRAALATFLARLPGPEISWVDEHLLVIAGRSRHHQAEPDGPASPANQAITDQALRISAGRAGQAPQRRPGGREQITPLRAQPMLATTFGTTPRSAATCYRAQVMVNYTALGEASPPRHSGARERRSPMVSGGS